jgi:prevent-host-death family protein
MNVYTYSEARQKLSAVLNSAASNGRVLIRRRDGRTFAVTPAAPRRSPLAVPSVKANVTTEELVSIIREGRRRVRTRRSR